MKKQVSITINGQTKTGKTTIAGICREALLAAGITANIIGDDDKPEAIIRKTMDPNVHKVIAEKVEVSIYTTQESR